MPRKRSSKWSKRYKALDKFVIPFFVLVSLTYLGGSLFLHQKFSNLLTLVFATGGIMFLVFMTLVIVLFIRNDIYEKTNNQHLISHTHVVGITICTMASAVPAFLVLLFITKYFDYLAIFLALVILSVVVVGLDTLNTRRTFREE